jgi:uncharacterized protein YutD
MEKLITVENNDYQIIENYRDAYNEEEFKSKMTDYFYDYDYVLCDWAYGKLRLKGFYDQKNSKVKDINNFDKVSDYIKENCAYGCRYFIAKKMYKK